MADSKNFRFGLTGIFDTEKTREELNKGIDKLQDKVKKLEIKTNLNESEAKELKELKKELQQYTSILTNLEKLKRQDIKTSKEMKVADEAVATQKQKTALQTGKLETESAKLALTQQKLATSTEQATRKLAQEDEKLATQKQKTALQTKKLETESARLALTQQKLATSTAQAAQEVGFFDSHIGKAAKSFYTFMSIATATKIAVDGIRNMVRRDCKVKSARLRNLRKYQIYREPVLIIM